MFLCSMFQNGHGSGRAAEVLGSGGVERRKPWELEARGGEPPGYIQG